MTELDSMVPSSMGDQLNMLSTRQQHLYTVGILLLSALSHGLHPNFVASSALLVALYFGALLQSADFRFAALCQLLPLTAGRLVATSAALRLLPGLQGVAIGVPVVFALSLPLVLALHACKLNRSILVFVRSRSPLGRYQTDNGKPGAELGRCQLLLRTFDTSGTFCSLAQRWLYRTRLDMAVVRLCRHGFLSGALGRTH